MRKKNLNLIEVSRKAKYSGLLLAILAGGTFATAQYTKEKAVNKKVNPWEVDKLSVDQRINEIVKAMSNEDKANFLVGTGMPGLGAFLGPVGDVKEGRVPGAAGGTYPMAKFGIPTIVVADGPAGLRINSKREGDNNTYYATAFPVGTALASTWNTKLLYQVGKSMGNETKEYGVDVLLAPALNIHRNPLNGRNFEYYSEDPVVSGKVAAAVVNGIQSNGVGTSVKHYAANNEETNRLALNAHISERAMREIYLKGFEITIKESKPWTVMSAYNKINGIYASENKDLLTTVLRDEWGYKGIVMTDWFGGFKGLADIRDGNSNVVNQINSGNDLLMPGLPKQKNAILDALNSGKISQETANRNVKNILQLVFRSPSFTNYKYSNRPDSEENANITRNAATEGMILLKNDQNTLPYINTSDNVALFGVTSYAWITGGTGSGSVNNKHTVSLLEGLDKAGYKLDDELAALYKPFAKKELAAEMEKRKAKGILALPGRLKEMEFSDEVIQKKAETNDIAFLTIGRNSGEGGDRAVDNDFNLAADEVELIDKVSKAFHTKGKKVVIILNIGGVIETASWKDKADAILLAWQPGQEGGHSVVDVLSGKANPSGKLTMTFPVKYSDISSAKNFPGTPVEKVTDVTYEEGIYVGYRYFDTFKVKPSYEFGYGKSYTTFAYSDIKADKNVFNRELTVKVKITNTGRTAGKEVVQLYLSAPAKQIDKPLQELKTFAKTTKLMPGESEVLELKLSIKDLASFVTSKGAWIAEAGNYKASVGASSTDIKGQIFFSLPKETVIEKVQRVFAPDLKFEDMKP
ncbi:glycoside hydrolase family 3 C-terminal domain-containing protein [Elizabethkingia anophelis]|uniref:beta-glucosidase n=1 Tax=Elizabethkingia anophelis TaxID=1117645 RepID=UPI0021A5F8B8|nr:glycoside hydrolase family 3 C-terminal domain-containing protein [Elizabethkingia anophelis]MCT3682430.1 glycoside hydrolase family 3 C-terminal domain-containing protein [Elizabethkingia anophelis]MCT3770641.1 glycoside hydrolase family 3 C-terminal domain-containing protein [Elizabethkingia anophelis]MCT3780929.1 glycoside hydrolase family 3 C-terminal domain-containing protein [Elizabethkingia anophelis]